MKKKILKGAIILMSAMMLGCSNKTSNDSKKKAGTECEYAMRDMGKKDDLAENYLGTVTDGGKTLYMVYKESFDSDSKEKPFSVDYYEFDIDKKELKQYKNIVEDDRAGEEDETYILYNEKSNKLLRYGSIDYEDMFVMYDLENGKTQDLEIDIYDYDAVQWVDEENILLYYENEINIYNVKTNDVTYIDSTEYLQVVDEDDEIITLDFEHAYLKDNMLTIFLSDILDIYVLEIDIKKAELNNSKDFESSIMKFGDKYIYCEQETDDATERFIIDVDNLDNVRELKGIDEENNMLTSVYIGDEYGYIFTGKSFSLFDLKNLEVSELNCTKKVDIAAFNVVNDVLYISDRSYLYKIDKDNDEINKMTEIFVSDKNADKEKYSVDVIKMFSNELGCVKYSSFGEETDSFENQHKTIWIYRNN